MLRRFFLATIVLLQFLTATSALAAAPTHLWSHTLGGDGTVDLVNGVAVDVSRNIIVVGTFSGTANFGGADLTSAGSGDIFIAKYTAMGEHVWSKRFGDTSNDVARCVTLDATGNIVVAGTFSGTVDFGGVAQVSAGSSDIFLCRYSPGGALSFSKRFGSTSIDDATSVTLDNANHILLVGDFVGTVDFGSGVGLISAGSSDVFVAQYTTAGGYVWAQRFGSTGFDAANGVASDLASNVLVIGEFANTVNFGGANLVSGGGADVFMAKYNSSGIHQWSQRFGGTGSEGGNVIATDAADNVIIAGTFVLTANFGGSNLVSAGAADIFMAKYNSAGVHQWSQRIGGALPDNPLAMATDAAGNVIVTGLFQGSTNFGGGALVSAANSDVFLAKYNSAGAHQWSRRAGGIGVDEGHAVAIDDAGPVINGGRFQNAADFGGGVVTASASSDGYIVKYDPADGLPDITSIKDIGNDQGRNVQIKFSRSGGDNADAAAPVNTYEAYRKQKAAPASSLAGVDVPANASRKALLFTGWTFVGSVPAHRETDYAIDAATIGDSTVALGSYNSVFFIRGTADNGTLFYDSLPDSGYSLDNLAPSVPQNFVYDAGDLSWDESKAADFDFFTVYGSNADNFGAATVVDYSVATAMDVSASPYAYYYVTATDFSGNEGKPARVHPLTGIGGTPKNYVLAVSNYPNPFNPRTTVSYTVPSRGHVTVRVFDAHGAHVATLFDGERNAGAYSVEWEGRAAGASVVASGVYFARIEHASGTRTKKMVVLK